MCIIALDIHGTEHVAGRGDDGEEDARRKVVVFNLISLRKHHVVEFMKKVRASTSHSLVVLAGLEQSESKNGRSVYKQMINEGR